MGPRAAWPAAFGSTLAAGALTEVLQFVQPNREPSLEDLLRDVAGAGAFLLAAATLRWFGGGGGAWISSRGGRRAAWTGATALVLIAGAHLGYTLAVLAARDAAMPVLVRLDGSWWERSLVRVVNATLTPGANPPRLPAGDSGTFARLELNPATYPGITVNEPYPDWRAYRRLTFTVVSDLDEPLELAIRIHDALHDQRFADRFNRRLTIVPGVNLIDIPLGEISVAPNRREMDMSRIRGILIFGYRLASPVHVFIGPLRLE